MQGDDLGTSPRDNSSQIKTQIPFSRLSLTCIDPTALSARSATQGWTTDLTLPAACLLTPPRKTYGEGHSAAALSEFRGTAASPHLIQQASWLYCFSTV